MGAPKGSRRNPDGRPKSDVIRLTKAARERFDRQLAENLDDVFKAILEVGTKEKDTAALSLLVNRAVPIRRGATVTFLQTQMPQTGWGEQSLGHLRRSSSNRPAMPPRNRRTPPQTSGCSPAPQPGPRRSRQP